MSEELPDPNLSLFPALEESHLRHVPSGTLFARIHSMGGPHPMRWSDFRTFGPTNSRFDPQPLPKGDYEGAGVMYGATDQKSLLPVGSTPSALDPPLLQTCAMEAFQDTKLIDTEANRPYFTLFETTRPLRLLDVSDSMWISIAGGNAAISAGSRAQSRKWARAIFSYYESEALDGIWYASSVVPPARVAALWELARDALPPKPLDSRPLADPALRAELESYSHELQWDLHY